MNKPTYVEYDFTPEIYVVHVYDNESNVIEDYQAGNSSVDSCRSPQYDNGSPTGTWARSTAREMAKEHGIKGNKVSRNTDLLDDHRENN